VEPELSPCVHLKKHMSSTKNIPILFQKKLIKPLAGFPPSLRLKEPQTKLTSFISTERLQEISWQDFWRSHAPRGASVA
jgi:hypothetical protein